MHYFKRSLIMSAVLAVSSICMTEYSAAAYDAPTDIHLTVESKEVDIADIPPDRVITLNIYLENCPQFNTMEFNVKIDPRLAFYPEHSCFGIGDGVSNMFTPGCSFYPDNNEYRKCSLCSRGEGDGFISYQNSIATLSVMLPEQVSAGDVFVIDLPDNYNDTPVSVALTQERESLFTGFPFTQLNSGQIRIIQNGQANEPQPSNNGGGQSNEGQGSGGGAVQQGGGNAPAPSQDSGGSSSETAATEVTVTETATVTTGQMTSTTSAKSTTTTTEISETTTETTTALTSASSSVTTEAITTGADEEPEKRNTGGLKTIIIITLIVAAVSSVSILAARLRMK